MTTPKPTAIHIGSPDGLPLDVVVTLAQLIDAAYPGSTLQATDGHMVNHRGEFVVVVDRSQYVELAPDQVADLVEAPSTGAEARFLGFEDSDGGATFAVTTPEEASLALSELVVPMLAHSEAANYLEVEVRDTDGNAYVVTAARSAGQTPSALHTQALERIAELEAELAQARAAS